MTVTNTNKASREEMLAFAQSLKTCEPYQLFKRKWDGRRVPRKGTAAFNEYQADAARAQAAVEALAPKR